MHQTKKGGQRHFGKKSRVGVDADSGLVHVAVNAVASVGDVIKLGELARDDEVVCGDSGSRAPGSAPKSRAARGSP